MTGTSPRMRGKPATKQHQRLNHRNIPAYAGKTLVVLNPASNRSEHPRVCGENSNSNRPPPACAGTSPRMRGKPTAICSPGLRSRNIPAYAGKTEKIYRLGYRRAEHPRVCGENGRHMNHITTPQGTSPRMRGKRSYRRRRPHSRRNIPAYAGKTCPHSRSSCS